jgi:C1A family cysteine protease
MKKISFFALAIFTVSAFARVDVAEVQKKINASNAKWKAKSNWVSELPESQIKKLMGNKELPKGNLDYTDVYSNSATYESIDWRNVNGNNWIGPVMNQGNCGSCVAFATIATLEAQTSIAAKAAWLKPQFSPQALFSCGGGRCDMGWYVSSGASYVKKNGVIDNSCAPYTMGSDGQDVSCKQFCNNQSERVFKVADTYTVGGLFGGSAAKVKEALKKGPLITSMTVYEDFLTYSSGIYKSVSSKSVGGHAVSIVGYSDEERYWLVRNSWGEDWGDHGFVKVSWDDKSGVGSTGIGFEVTMDSKVVSIESPSENAYVSGEYNIKIRSSEADDFSIKVLKNGKEIQKVAARRMSKGMNEATLNTMNMENGKYDLVAVSDRDAKIKSLTRGFTVSNTKPDITIGFTAHDGVDLSKPVKGRLEFDVTVDSHPIQLQKIDFMVTKLDGTLVTKRTTEVVLNKMLLGFRFNSIPDGEYLIFFRGYLPANGENFFVDSEKIKVLNKNK